MQGQGTQGLGKMRRQGPAGPCLQRIGKGSAENMASSIASLFTLLMHHTPLLYAAENLDSLVASRFTLTPTARAVQCALLHRAECVGASASHIERHSLAVSFLSSCPPGW